MTKKMYYEELEFAKVDHHRPRRKGFPEVIYGEGKTPQQIAAIALRIYQRGQPVLVTRADKKAYRAVKKAIKGALYFENARIIIYKKVESRKWKVESRKQGAESRKQGAESRKWKAESRNIAIITAGTSDLPVAEEAAVTATFLGLKPIKIYDVGVAGIHRLLNNMDKINQAEVLIVVAGMEGALPSVIGGLTNKPIIAVPTSVGYGSSFKGLAALLTMLNSCSPGVAVVNIDNGFGAAVMAFTIMQIK